MIRTRTRTAVAIAATALMAGAPAAQAATGALEGYATNGDKAQGDVAGVESGSGPSSPSHGTAAHAAASTQPQSVGGLPFTGLDLLVTGGAGLVLVGTGLALRGAVRRPAGDDAGALS